MGGGIGQYALYRAEDGSLCLFSLVIPPGAQTPIHDHLAWGMIGVYRGIQYETLDVIANAKAMDEMVNLSGQTFAPVIEVDGKILADFGPEELSAFWEKISASSSN